MQRWQFESDMHRYICDNMFKNKITLKYFNKNIPSFNDELPKHIYLIIYHDKLQIFWFYFLLFYYAISIIRISNLSSPYYPNVKVLVYPSFKSLDYSTELPDYIF
jgi:hypothetical protein